MQNLLLLHGAIGSREQFVPLEAKLANYYTLHTMNFGGHGGETFPGEPFSISLFADEVKAYLEKLAIPGINIFGYSMGGYVAMYLAKKYPFAVQKIATLASKFDWSPVIAIKETSMLNADALLEKVPSFAKQLQDRHAPNDWKEVLERTKMMLLALGNNNSLKLPDYKTIVQPCLLLIGDKDLMVSVDETAPIAGALPNATHRVLPETPHPLEQVNMLLLAGVLKDFFA
jgi:pimeloyl-ACP methyl ester carboxylesterase